MLLGWIETGTETQRRHAQVRLAIAETDPPASVPSSPAPLSASIRAAKLGFRRCLYSTHEGCGCSGTHCHHLGRIVSLPDCLSCLPTIKDQP